MGLTELGYLSFGLVSKYNPNARLVSTFSPDGSEMPKDVVLICTKDKEFASLLIKHGIISTKPIGEGKAETILGEVMFDMYVMNPEAEKHLRAQMATQALIKSISGIRRPDDYDA